MSTPQDCWSPLPPSSWQETKQDKYSKFRPSTSCHLLSKNNHNHNMVMVNRTVEEQINEKRSIKRKMVQPLFTQQGKHSFECSDKTRSRTNKEYGLVCHFMNKTSFHDLIYHYQTQSSTIHAFFLMREGCIRSSKKEKNWQ